MAGRGRSVKHKKMVKKSVKKTVSKKNKRKTSKSKKSVRKFISKRSKNNPWYKFWGGESIPEMALPKNSLYDIERKKLELAKKVLQEKIGNNKNINQLAKEFKVIRNRTRMKKNIQKHSVFQNREFIDFHKGLNPNDNNIQDWYQKRVNEFIERKNKEKAQNSLSFGKSLEKSCRRHLSEKNCKKGKGKGLFGKEYDCQWYPEKNVPRCRKKRE